ncbi:peptide/nickel transport system permease protein [Amycolatopsis sulphurea]|uniref:Peptide/nickel transport system permease protein n=1 Tax=Amycolatopsis sulphurea TaxID=76022 RepID=A0A2A9FJH9_9PSEU|nr:ABC transporter permease [Amycolatopsis sulphurea]PFG50660.1 peptide/nickel transport system permease protein [Amycolatopsis sulphurea]
MSDMTANLPASVTASATKTTGSRLGFRIGLTIVGVAIVVAIVGPYLVPHDPYQQDLMNRLAAPSGEHWLGTDALGRDVFSRLVAATRVDLGVGILGALFPFLLGTLLGCVAAYFGSIWDAIVMRLTDLVLAFPVYVLIITLIAVGGSGTRTLLIAFTAVGWVGYARLVRSVVLRVKNEDYISAARLGGVSHGRIMVRHLLPNVLRSSLTLLVTDVMFVLLGLASFSYLGLGIQPPTPDWGAMIADAQPYMQQQWWLIAAPGAMVALVGSGLMLIGERLDDRTH